jgi:hypothetical protein
MVGCGGKAPIIVSRWTNAAARAPLPALWAGAGCSCDWASDGESPLGADSVSGDDSEGVSAGASSGVSIVIGAGSGAVTDTLGVTGALMGLIGDSGLVGLVTDLVHVSLTRFHWPQIA